MVRLSGAGIRERLQPLLVPPLAGWSRRPRAVTLSWDPSEPPVPAVLLLFPAGGSYTGEESAEIYLPSAPPLVRRLLEELRGQGVRPAEPGEFTRRAFVNGRIDLTQAEAVAECIAAESLEHARAARRTLEGDLGRKMRELGDEIHDLVAMLEAGLDFAEQEVEAPDPSRLRRQITPILEETWSLAADPARVPREEARLRLLIWGRANAGKSTLLNRIAGRDAAITSAIPGTTTDPVSVRLAGHDLRAVELVDLPGRRESESPLGAAAASLGRDYLGEGDALLYIFDATRAAAEIHDEWQRLGPKLRARAWPVINKLDLLPVDDAQRTVLSGCLCCSALTGLGVEALRQRLREHLRRGSWISRGAGYLFTERQLGSLRTLAAALERALDALDEGEVQPELLVADLRLAHASIEEVTGALSTEETLDRIFEGFCVGK